MFPTFTLTWARQIAKPAEPTRYDTPWGVMGVPEWVGFEEPQTHTVLPDAVGSTE